MWKHARTVLRERIWQQSTPTLLAMEAALNALVEACESTPSLAPAGELFAYACHFPDAADVTITQPPPEDDAPLLAAALANIEPQLGDTVSAALVRGARAWLQSTTRAPFSAEVQAVRDTFLRGDNTAFTRLASQLYAASGEISQPYYELLVLAGDNARRKGQHTRAQSLYRRATLVSQRLGADPQNAKKRSACRWPAYPKALPSERIVVALDSDCRLWRWQPERIDFLPSEPAPYRWYFLAPKAWRGEAEARCSKTLELLFAVANETLAENDPSDANFIGFEPRAAAILDGAALVAEQWQMQPTTWLEQRGFVVEDSGAFFAAAPSDFVPLCFLAEVLNGTLENSRSMQRLRELKFSEAVLARHQDPKKEFTEALAYFVRPL